MAIEPILEARDVQPGKIDPDTLMHMGRLIRAFAEIEDIIGLFLFKVAGISQSTGQILIGQLSVSMKLRKAQTFCELLGGKAVKLYQTYFDSENFKDCLKVRNVVAHGKFVGITKEGEYVFVLDEIHEASEGFLTVGASTFHPLAFSTAASSAEDAIPILEKSLLLQKQREERLGQGLLPHKRTRKTTKPAVPRGRPQRPSKGKP